MFPGRGLEYGHSAVSVFEAVKAKNSPVLVPGTRKAVGKDGFTSPGLSGYRLNGVILSHAIAIDSRSTDRFGISFCWELSPVGYRIVISRVYQVAVVVGSIEFCGLPSLGELGGHVGSGELVAVDGPAAAGGLGWGGLCWCGVGCGVVSGGDEVGDGDCEGYEEDAHGGEDDGGLGVTLGWWLLWGGLVLGVCRAGLAGVVGLVWGVGWAAGLGVARGSGWCLAVVGGLSWVVRRLGHQGSSGSRGRGSYCNRRRDEQHASDLRCRRQCTVLLLDLVAAGIQPHGWGPKL